MVFSSEFFHYPQTIRAKKPVVLLPSVVKLISDVETGSVSALLPQGKLPEVGDTHKPPQALFPHLAMELVKQFGAGFSVERQHVVWKQKEQDFLKLLELKAIFDEDLSDDELEKRIPEIERILLSTFLFQKLDDPSIQVTALHVGTTPFRHTINVLRKLRTKGLSAMEVRAMRWSAIWHDVGKIFGAVHPAGMFHSHLSASISSEFLFRYCKDLSEVQVLRTEFAVQYHHTPEGYQKWISDEEMENRWRDKETAIGLYLLVAADVTSIEGFRPEYIVNLNSILKRFNPEAYRALQELDLLVSLPLENRIEISLSLVALCLIDTLTFDEVMRTQQ